MTQKSALSRGVILQASCSRAKLSSEGCVSITPAWWRRSRPDRKEAELNAKLPDTHTDVQWAAIAGSWPRGTVSGCNLLRSSELGKYVYVPVMGQQNDADLGVLEPMKGCQCFCKCLLLNYTFDSFFLQMLYSFGYFVIFQTAIGFPSNFCRMKIN